LTRAELIAGNYPPKGAEQMKVAFTSDEDIQRETGGNYWTYFKESSEAHFFNAKIE
jgi:hypothetical protein